MALSAFDDKSSEPNPDELAAMLGRTYVHWEALRARLAGDYQPLTETWNYSGKKYGWSLRLIQKKRTILYMVPCRKHFLAAFALGEKAAKAAHDGDLPESVLAAVDEAPKYAEGRGVRLAVKTKSDLESIKKLAAVKMAN